MTAAVLRLLEAVAGRMSLESVQRVGALLGLFFHALIPIRRREVRRALEERLGTSAAAARAIARSMYRHLGVSALEFLWMGRQSLPTLEARVRRDGWERYEAARARGHGVVIVTAHVGNWDLGACSQAALGEPLHVVTRSLKARGLNAFWMRRRSRMGVVLHPAVGSARALIGALRRGETVGMIIDQRDEHGIWCPFLGADALTSTAATTLAIRAGAPLLPAFSLRDADGSHTLRIGEPIEIDQGVPVGEAIRSATRRCNEALEEVVRAHPEQWLWLHRRWASLSAAAAEGGPRLGSPRPPMVTVRYHGEQPGRRNRQCFETSCAVRALLFHAPGGHTIGGPLDPSFPLRSRSPRRGHGDRPAARASAADTPHRRLAAPHVRRASGARDRAR